MSAFTAVPTHLLTEWIAYLSRSQHQGYMDLLNDAFVNCEPAASWLLNTTLSMRSNRRSRLSIADLRSAWSDSCTPGGRPLARRFMFPANVAYNLFCQCRWYAFPMQPQLGANNILLRCVMSTAINNL